MAIKKPPEFPEHLFAEWHPTKNGGLSLNDFTPGSNVKVWWQCLKDSEHPGWPAMINNRARKGKGCPCCAGRIFLPKDSFASKSPDLVLEIDLEHPLNKGIDPWSLGPQSDVKIYWKCLENSKHPGWKTSVSNRTARFSGCPHCDGKKTIREESFGYLYPRLMKDFVQELNPGIDPWSLSPRSHTKIVWKCYLNPNHPTWTTALRKRTIRNHGCGHCSERFVTRESSFAAKSPELLKEFDYDHPQNKGIDPYALTPRSDRRVGWRCQNCNHTWCTTVRARVVDGSACSRCSPVHVSRLEIKIASEIYKLFGMPVADSVADRKVDKWDCDMVFRELNLIIEYDSARFHGSNFGKDDILQDQKKTKELEKLGWHVIRIRETPLPKITKYDVMVKSGGDIHSAVCKTLDQILVQYPELSDKFSDYRTNNKLIAENEAKLILAGKRRKSVKPL
jgi:hypothetical protein